MATWCLLANGAPPTHPRPLEQLRLADRLVCCDGAYAAALRFGREPDFVVGDGDSIAPDARRRLGERFVAVAEQDTNDLAKAFRFVVARHPGRIVILGATGRREDHALGNIFWLFDFAAVFPAVSMWTDYGVFEIVATPRTFTCTPGEHVSLFVPDPATRISSRGLVWALDGLRFGNLL